MSFISFQSVSGNKDRDVKDSSRENLFHGQNLIEFHFTAIHRKSLPTEIYLDSLWDAGASGI